MPLNNTVPLKTSEQLWFLKMSLVARKKHTLHLNFHCSIRGFVTFTKRKSYSKDIIYDLGIMSL